MLDGEQKQIKWEGYIDNAIKEKRVIDVDPLRYSDFVQKLEKEKRTSRTVSGGPSRATAIPESSLKNSLADFKKFVKQFREKNKINYSAPSSENANQQTSDETDAVCMP